MADKIIIGFITYGEATAKYLPYFIPSLKAQTYQDFKIMAFDNSERPDNENAAYLKNNYPEIVPVWSGKNLGFARAFNLMISRAIADGARYFLALNPDMIIEVNFIEEIVNATALEERIGAVAPKILKWNFSNNGKTRSLDSLGLRVTREHRFFDERQGEIDEPKNYASEEVFGFTGAAALLNLKALVDVAYADGARREYFDELMFMYKEDCDLSYRLRLAGWKIILAPLAVAYHNRAVASIGGSNWQIIANRRHKSRQVKRWSFLNQLILLCKLKNLPFSLRVRLATARYQIKGLIFVLFFESFLLKELAQFWRLRREIKKRRQSLVVRVAIKEIEKFMT